MNSVLNILIIVVPWVCSITSVLMLINNKYKLDPMLKEDIYNNRKLNIYIVYLLQFVIMLITLNYYLINPVKEINGYTTEEFTLIYLCLFIVIDFVPLVLDVIVAILLINSASQRKAVLSKKLSRRLFKKRR